MIRELSYDDGKELEGLNRVRDVVAQVLRDNHNFIYPTIASSINDNANADKAFELLINHIQVNTVHIPIEDQKSRLLWNISTLSIPNFCDLDAYNTFRQTLLSLTFPTAGYGIGKAATGRDAIVCVYCKSCDHPTAKCPFPQIPGWMIPQDEAFPWSNPTVERKRGRGGSRVNQGRICTSSNPFRR